MLKNAIANWKTTSAGLGIIVGSIVHVAFAIKGKSLDEPTLTTGMLGVLTGVGLIVAGDANAPARPAATATQDSSQPTTKTP